jgi:atypical dual specificity phosphatase
MAVLNFGWMIEGELAGSGRPCTKEELVWLKEQGIGAIVSLTETSLRKDKVLLPWLDALEFAYQHIPIVDHTAPEQSQIDEFIEFIKMMRGEKKPILVHCAGGYGRTGTMMACYLVSIGHQPKVAVDEVRRKRPYSIEGNSQEESVFEYGRRLGRE